MSKKKKEKMGKQNVAQSESKESKCSIHSVEMCTRPVLYCVYSACVME